jgi:hypothetical protein
MEVKFEYKFRFVGRIIVKFALYGYNIIAFSGWVNRVNGKFC